MAQRKKGYAFHLHTVIRFVIPMFGSRKRYHLSWHSSPRLRENEIRTSIRFVILTFGSKKCYHLCPGTRLHGSAKKRYVFHHTAIGFVILTFASKKLYQLSWHSSPWLRGKKRYAHSTKVFRFRYPDVCGYHAPCDLPFLSCVYMYKSRHAMCSGNTKQRTRPLFLRLLRADRRGRLDGAERQTTQRKLCGGLLLH